MGCSRESELDKKITRLVRGRGGWISKIHGNEFVQGIPDHLICYRGRFVAIESKSPEGTTRPLQKIHIRSINKAGGRAVSTRSIKVVEDILNEIDRDIDGA